MTTEHFHQQLEHEFRWFHSHPELSYEEYETTKRIRALMENARIEILDLPLETGLVAVIRGRQPGPVIALRCDIDALPIGEETDLEWKSQAPGRMHACGHDFHTTVLFGTALLLKAREQELCGTVKLIFQPAEESSLGALTIIETGVLEDVKAIFGIHSSSEFPVGTLGIREGSVTAAVDRFEITLTGSGTHGAHPDTGRDPIVAAAAIIASAQTIVSRNLNPFSAGLVSITRLSAGNTWNVIPETASLEGTVRTLSPVDRSLIESRLREVAEFTAKAYGVQAELDWTAGPPATDNDRFWAGLARDVAAGEGLKTKLPAPSLGGEDFAFYQQDINGLFIQIGTGASRPNHHPGFQVDPAALPGAAEFLSSLAIQALLQLAEGGRR